MTVSPSLRALKKELCARAHPQKAAMLSRYFKTGAGEYGEGDIFLGVMVPDEKIIASRFKDLALPDGERLLQSHIHEERAVALIILEEQYGRGNPKTKREIYRLYMRNLAFVNNWDLIDFSAPAIVGAFLEGKPKTVLYRLARSRNLWKRRIAMLATHSYIKKQSFDDALAIAEILVHDTHDLIHKAVGWSLREIGKQSLKSEEEFLRKYYKKMPRTMLRYAIEKFSPIRRKAYREGAA